MSITQSNHNVNCILSNVKALALVIETLPGALPKALESLPKALLEALEQ